MTVFRWPTPRLNRRSLLQAAGVSVGAALVTGDSASWAKVGAYADGVELSEATNIAVAPSPDGKTILFDLLGLLWIMPIEGGAARCLSDAFADLAYPCWSPDGRRIAFQSYRSGNFHIWTVAADGSDARQLTDGFADHREPCFTPDGRAILFSSDRAGRYLIYRLDLASGAVSVVSNGEGQHSEPCVSADGRNFAYVVDGKRLMLAKEGGKAAEAASVPKAVNWGQPSGLHAPGFAPDGRLAFVTIVEQLAQIHVGDGVAIGGEDIYPFRPGWLPNGDMVYASGGKIRRKPAGDAAREIPFTAKAAVSTPSYAKRQRDYSGAAPRPVVGIASPALSPDGQRIAFGALGDIHVLTIGDAKPRRISSGSSGKCHPAWSPDGRSLVYSDDRSGLANLWLHDVITGKERQLTNVPNAAATFPCWSPDGARLAFLNQYGALHLVDVASGEIRQLYDALWLPGRPSFSPDGTKIALAAFKPTSARYREGLSEILVIDIASGKGRYAPIRPDRSIATRGDDGPVWSPDGRYLAYVFASTLWVQPVDADGNFQGAARQLTPEVTDAPSWSGDARTLLYLSNGRLRTVSVDGGPPRGVPLRMSWSLARAPAASLIEGARIWDALRPEYRDGDVVLKDNRIADIIPLGSAKDGNLKRIDGRGLTLMPGMIDMHTHRQIHGSPYGDRMGRALLAMGITATRSPGGAAYHTIEDREAVDAGLRTAPRHFTTGEALDGGRIYYNFMRPMTESGQLALEMARAEALGYDMIKTYVRLDHRTQADVIAAAHAHGMPVSSHYHYPALRQGGDCTEHLGATNRFGFSRTISYLGAGYDDVNKLFAAARAGRTPTLFSANALLPDYPELIADPRIRTLLPPWDLARLDGLAKTIGSGDRTPLLASLERNIAQIKAMMADGWHVHSGTDTPIDTIGVSYHLNLRAMVRFGISPYETLLTATRHAGAALSAPLGTIARGQLADLILVDGDPLADITAVARVRLLIRDGRAIGLPTLTAPFEKAVAAIGPSHVHAMARTAGDSYFWHRAAYVEAGRAACCAGHRVASA